jgi:hypothetical protein
MSLQEPISQPIDEGSELNDQRDREHDRRFEVLDRLRAAFVEVPPEELEQEIANALAEVRQEMAIAVESPG